MPHIVLCPYCNIKFDRDKIKYVRVGKNRYAHAECGLEQAKLKKLPLPEVVDPTNQTNCIYCKKAINKTDSNIIKVSEDAYAHEECQQKENQRELTDEEKLHKYIMKLFNTTYIYPRIQRQIKTYINDYHFSYSGILKALIYFYEVKNNSIAKANDGIGIVPYVYKDAYNYYYSIWLAQQKNINLNINNIKPKEKEIFISKPQRNVSKRNLFTFLNKE